MTASMQVSEASSNTAPVREAPANAFVQFGVAVRIAIVIYVVTLKVIVPAVLAPRQLSGSTAAVLWIANLVQYGLLLFPIIALPKRVGWLHPLTFPFLWALAKGFPGDIARLTVLASPTTAPVPATHDVMPWALSDDLGNAMLAESLLTSLGLLAYYAGFFLGPRFAVPKLPESRPRNAAGKMFMACLVGGVIGVLFIVSQGGIGGVISSWAGGRFRALRFAGPMIVLVGIMPASVMVWFALEPRSGRNPLFLASVVATCLFEFLMTGSRSAPIYVLIWLGMIWMLRERRLPLLRVAALGVTGILLIGLLGQLRRSGWEADREAVEGDNSGLVNDALIELQERQRSDPSVGVVGRVMGGEPLLMGESYVGALLFFIPRVIWHDKPRGAGAIYVSKLYGQGDMSYGIPIGAVAEAFWNFHVVGVILVFFLYGMFHDWLARFLLGRPEDPARWVLFIATVFRLRPATDSFIPFMHLIVPLVFLLWVSGGLRIPMRLLTSNPPRRA